MCAYESAENARSEAEDRFGEPEPEGRASIRVSCVSCAVLFSTVCFTDPTLLPARKEVLALMYAPLDNHKIAIGCIHLTLHLFS